MARPNQRGVTQREVQSNDRRPVQLNQNRRFFTSGGFQDGVRAARALENAFQTGVKFAGETLDEANADGSREAAANRAAGMDRDAARRNKGYNDAWDQLDAEYDFNLFKKEMSEVLRGADWESRSEAEVQELINTQARGFFDGAENLGDSAYAQYIAPRLLEAETEIIGQHRDMAIAAIQEEQVSKVVANAETYIESNNGEYDDETVFDRTGTFLDGPRRKDQYWKIKYYLAEKYGDPAIIEGTPDDYNGIPTGINDPDRLAAHQNAINSAYSVQNSESQKASAAAENARKAAIFDVQTSIIDRRLAGRSVDEQLQQLKDLDASFSDYSTAESFARSYRNDAEAQSPQEDAVAQLWLDIYDGKAGATAITEAYNAGQLGFGEASTGLLKSMRAQVQTLRSGAESESSRAVGTFRTEITGRYNPATEGMLKGLDTAMLHIRTQAVAEYNELVYEQGTDPLQARRQVFEKFDPLVTERVPNADSQSVFAATTLQADTIKGVLSGTTTPGLAMQGQTRASLLEGLQSLVESGDLTKEEAGQFFADYLN